MHLKVFRIISIALFLCGTTFAIVAHAQVGGGEGGGNVQTPVQVIVQIIVTAIALKALQYFNLP